MCIIQDCMLAEKPVADNSVNRLQAMIPPNFLALGVGAAIVRNPNLVNPYALYFRNTCRKLGLDTKTRTSQIFGDLANMLSGKYLKPRFHIGKVEVSTYVRKCRKKRVPDIMPKIQNPPGLRAHKPRAVNYICSAREDGGEEHGVICRVVFQIGVLNKNNVAGCFLQSCFNRRAFPHISLEPNEFDSRLTFDFRLSTFDYSAAAVGGGVIYQNNLFFQPARVGAEHFIKNYSYRFFFVEEGDYYGEGFSHTV